MAHVSSQTLLPVATIATVENAKTLAHCVTLLPELGAKTITLLEGAARNAFRELPVGILRRIATSEGHELPKITPEVVLLRDLLQHILPKASADEILSIMSQRARTKKTTYDEVVLEARKEEGVFDKRDEKNVRDSGW